MRTSLLFLVFLGFINIAAAQTNMNVKSFKMLEHDLEARRNPVKDQNGENCALIKIVTSEKNFFFEGDAFGISKKENKTGEIWLYVPRGAKRLTIKHDKLGVLRDYVYTASIKEATVYEMILTTGKVITTVVDEEIPTQWVAISSQPTGADVYIDEVYVGPTPFTKKIDLGNHTYRIELGLYQTEAGKFELTEQVRKDIEVTLKPNFGIVEITSSPEQGATVDIDGIPTNKTTPFTSSRLVAGKHKATVKKLLFSPKTIEFNIVPGQTTKVNAELDPNFATINISTTPEADIYIDDEYKGKGSYYTKVMAGLHTIEARKDKHYPDKKQQAFTIGENVTISLHPTPITGKADIVTNPFGATIKLNGKEYGTAPATLRDILIGDYTLTLEKEGYETITKSITITENQTTMMREELVKGVFIKSSTMTENDAIKIVDVKTQKNGYEVKVSYRIQGGKFNHTFDVALYVSTDGGRTFQGPMKTVTGDVGAGIKSGSHMLTWNYYSDIKSLGNNVVYDVRAEVNTKEIERKFFVHYTGNYSLRGSEFIAPIGLSIGQIGKIGWYISARMNTDAFISSDYDFDGADIIGYDKILYYNFDTDYKHPSLEAVAGITAQLNWNFFLYAGAGYGYQKYYWHMNEFDYMTNEQVGDSYLNYKDYSVSGITAEAGFIVRAKAISFNVGYSTLNFEYSNIVFGIGFNF
jgi:hypothetical protein